VTVDEVDGRLVATGIALLAVDRDSGEGTVLLVPTATVADVPGYGTFRLGEAFDFGGAGLVGVSLDNLLGVRVDGVATVTGAGWARVFDAVEGRGVALDEQAVPDPLNLSGDQCGKSHIFAWIGHRFMLPDTPSHV
jgi:anionic cell wall polymer biosynthesis LytR-Cps2A-Psr (LCP) family protein